MTFRFMRAGIAAAALVGAASTVPAPGAATGEDLIARGEYLAHIMDCTGCHTPGALTGNPDMTRYLGGGDVGFYLPGLGIFWPRNLTPDEATGLGSWSVDDIVKAVRTGETPDGRILAPIMPTASYGKLSDEDAIALATFLKSLPPVPNQVPDPVGGPEQATAPYLSVVVPGQ